MIVKVIEIHFGEARLSPFAGWLLNAGIHADTWLSLRLRGGCEWHSRDTRGFCACLTQEGGHQPYTSAEHSQHVGGDESKCSQVCRTEHMDKARKISLNNSLYDYILTR